MATRMMIALIFYLPFLLLITSCKSNKIGGGKSPQESYGDRLKRVGLDSSAMGIRWFAAAEKSLATPLTIQLPFKESGFFSPDDPIAFGYRIALRQGQQLNITVNTRSDLRSKIFIELWGPSRRGTGLELLQYADSSGLLIHEAKADVSLVLRIQSELLAPLSYELTASTGPSLAFPVSGGTNKSIGSIWGDSRDAGARSHEGIDIFAKRGTPVLAAAEGRISAVREGGIGGKTVWLRPSGKDINLYYAHLDSQLVSTGQKVNAGDTVGLVGNTGNARNTPSHLHFGIYGNGGAIDPIYFVRTDNTKPASITGNQSWLGKAVRTTARQNLLPAPTLKSGTSVLDKSTYLVITAAIGAYYKVLLPDRSEGFVPVSAVSLLDRSIETITETSPLLYAPLAGSAIVAAAPPSSLPVKAWFNGFAYVDNGTVRGWMFIR
ncbi:MAG TPA: M23 family metallopeptidase [Pseudobacter sp.]|nr:M23 family metallopeptidase [Pseudobacter sp.]